jgi:hypothetical protein
MDGLIARPGVLAVTLIAALCTGCSDPALCADSDGDNVCDMDDLCLGNDLVGDSDNDGVCDDIDDCEGQVEDDTDRDGVCDDIDVCWGNDALGDPDADGICADLDLCTGDDATGDTDGDGVCDEFDVYEVAYLDEYTVRTTSTATPLNGVLAIVNVGHDYVDLANVSVVSASDDHTTAEFDCLVIAAGTLLAPGESQGDLWDPVEALLVGQGLPITEPHTNAGLQVGFRMSSFPAGDFDLNGSCVLNVDGIQVTIQVLFHRIDSGSGITYDSVTRHAFY